MLKTSKMILASTLVAGSAWAQTPTFENEYCKVEFFKQRYFFTNGIYKVVNTVLPENDDASKRYLLRRNSDNTFEYNVDCASGDSAQYMYRVIVKKPLADYQIQSVFQRSVNGDTVTFYASDSLSSVRYKGTQLHNVRTWPRLERLEKLTVFYNGQEQDFKGKDTQLNYTFDLPTCNGFINLKQLKVEVAYTALRYGKDVGLLTSTEPELRMTNKKPFKEEYSTFNVHGQDSIVEVDMTTSQVYLRKSYSCSRYAIRLNPINTATSHVLSTPDICLKEGEQRVLATSPQQGVYWFKNGELIQANAPQITVTTPGVYSYSLDQNRAGACQRNSNPVQLSYCKTLKGFVFLDSIHNHIKDATEANIATVKIYIPELGKTLYTNANGYFSVDVPTVTRLTLQIEDPRYHAMSYELRISETGVSGVYKDPLTGSYADFGFGNQQGCQLHVYKKYKKDANLFMPTFFVRPGFDVKPHMRVQNFGAEKLEGLLTLEYELPLYDPATFTEESVEKGIFKETWPLSLSPGTSLQFTKALKALASSPLGEYVKVKAYISCPGDESRGNDTVDLSILIRGSFDPNDIAVDPVGPSYEEQILKNTDLDYTIRFQNTGSDTAFTVVLRDTLPTALDPNSVTMLGSSHSYTLTINKNILIWTYDNIKLVDSTTSEPQSHGWVQYRIKQKKNAPVGTEISNKAAIYFDFNKPVSTNVAYNRVVEALPQVVTSLSSSVVSENVLVYPNPSTGSITVEAASGGDFKLMDLAGRSVMQVEVSGTKILDIRSLEPGLYYYTFGGSKAHKLMVK